MRQLETLAISVMLAGATVVSTARAETWQELLARADSLRRVAQYDSVLVCANRVLEIAEREFGKDDTTVANALWYIGDGYYNLGRYPEAEPPLLRAKAIIEKKLGVDDPKSARVVRSLASVYLAQARYPEAEVLDQRALYLDEKVYGTRHKVIVMDLNNLAGVYFYQQKYAEADSLFQRCLEVNEQILGPDHPDVARSLNNLAAVRGELARYDEAKSLFERALAIREKALGPDHPDVGESLNNLGSLYAYSLGRYADAEPLLLRARKIYEKAFGPEHPRVASCISNLGRFYHDSGQHDKAEPLYLHALALKEKLLGPDHPNVAETVELLAALYGDEGRYADSEQLHRRALTIYETVLGPDALDLALVLNNIAVNCMEQEKLAEAEQLIRRALTIEEKALGPDHPDVAVSLTNLATVYFVEKRDADAEPLLLRAMAIRETSLGADHPKLSESLMALANCYMEQGRTAEAQPLYERSLRIYENTFGPDHWYVADQLSVQAAQAIVTGDYTQARDLESRAWSIWRNSFLDGASVVSERSALEYSDKMNKQTALYLTILLNSSLAVTTKAEEIAHVLFSAKGMVSEGILTRDRTLADRADPVTLALADSLKLARYALSKLYVDGPDEAGTPDYRRELISAREKKERLEAELARCNADFNRTQKLRDVHAADVAAALPAGASLVEFVRYKHHLTPDSTEPRYLVIVLKNKDTPTVFALGPAGAIDTAVMFYRRQIRDPQALDMEAYAAAADNLYSLVWRPFAAFLRDASTVFIAPDGDLNLVSFAGLRNDDGRYLIEDHPLHHLSTARDLIRLQDRPASGSGLLAMGDPDFNMSFDLAEAPIDTSAVPEGVGILLAYMNPRSSCEELNKLDVPALPATRREVDAVAAQWAKTQTEPVGYYTGDRATEENFKQNAPGKRVLHLATHGFYLSDACQPGKNARTVQTQTAVGENPFLQCGLLLAGANQHGHGAEDAKREDGIVTAEEVAGLNLHGTGLVVLSACETGLGEVRAGEGVYGLRRAFQMAGACTVISALWPIDDRATAEFMSQLFSAQNEDLPHIMQRIALSRISTLRNQGKSDHPFYWAGFVATGDWKMP